MSRTIPALALAVVFLGGCQATHLVYVHDAMFGLDVAASTQGTGRVSLGYDQNTFALVPRKNENQTSDAMSLVAISCVYADGLSKVNFDHFVTTGKAATSVANDTAGLQKIRSALYGKDQECP